MTPDAFTRKTLEALQNALELAGNSNHSSLELAHILKALAKQADTAFSGLIQAYGVKMASLTFKLS
ncbi:hypothetical protein DYH10_04280 [Candidatus Saccharibacteria bacterium CPR2]|nr:hypothetical protein [Candidatus Saccharibacteria bacterium CPR2]